MGTEDFDTMVGLLTRAAIDACFCGPRTSSSPQTSSPPFRRVGNHYEFPTGGGTAWLTRPGPDGYGGGRLRWADGNLMTQDEVLEWAAGTVPYEGMCDGIMARIEGIVGRWRHLPDLDSIQVQVDAWKTVYRAFLQDDEVRPVGAVTEFGQGTMSDNLTRVLDIIHGTTYGPVLDGEAASAFRRYMDNLLVAVNRCRDLTLAVGTVMAAQKGLWEGVRSDVTTVLKNTTARLDEIAEMKEGAISLEAVFTLGSMVSGAVGLFTGPVGGAASFAVGTVLTLVGSAVAETDDVRHAEMVHDYSSALNEMDILLEGDGRYCGLNGLIVREEENIRSNLMSNYILAQMFPGMDPTPGVIESAHDIRRPTQEVTDAIYAQMTAISDELDRIADHAREGAAGAGSVPGRGLSGTRSLVDRGLDIGIGPTGPTDDFVQLADLLGTTLYELAWEVDAGKRNLKAAMDLLDEFDVEVQNRLAAISAEYADGYHGDGR